MSLFSVWDGEQSKNDGKTVEVRYSTVKMCPNYRCAGFRFLSVGCKGYLIKAEAIFTEILKQFLILALIEL